MEIHVIEPKCIDMLQLKNDTDTQILELSNGFQEGVGVSAESRNRLCYDEIDLMISGGLQHFLKTRSILFEPRDTKIVVNTRKLIRRIGSDFFFVMLHLVFQRVCLFLFFR